MRWGREKKSRAIEEETERLTRFMYQSGTSMKPVFQAARA